MAAHWAITTVSIVLSMISLALLIRARAPGTKIQLEAEVTEQAFRLFRGLRDEYAAINSRLQMRVDSSEAQHVITTRRIDELESALNGAQHKEQQYQETIARQDKEIAKLRKSLAALQRENVTLSRLVDELRNEVDGFRADMRGD